MTNLRSYLAALVLFMLLAQAVSAQTPRSLGYLTRINGNIKTIRDGVLLPAVERSRLREGDKVSLDNKACVEAVHLDAGKRYLLKAGQTYLIEAGRILLVSSPPKKPGKTPSSKSEPEVVGRFSTGLSKQVTAEPDGNSGKLLGRLARPERRDLHTPTPFGAISPTDALKLTWKNTIRPPENSEDMNIEVAIYREGEAMPLCSKMVDLNSTDYTLTKDKLEIKPGEMYRWEAIATGAGIGVQKTEGYFWLLTEEENKSLEVVKKETAALRQNNKTSALPDMLLGMEMRRLGLFLEALDAYHAALALENTNEAAIAAIEELEKLTLRAAASEDKPTEKSIKSIKSSTEDKG